MDTLEIPSAWREKPPVVPGLNCREIPKQMALEIRAKIMSLSSRSKTPQAVVELFKRNIARETGQSYRRSSDLDFAEFDLQAHIEKASSDAVGTIAGLAEAASELITKPLVSRPFSIAQLNNLLRRHDMAYRVENWKLVLVHREPSVPTKSDAWELAASEVREAVEESDRLLTKKKWRGAVSTAWWVIESLSTLYAKAVIDGTPVKGTYFNEIVKDLASRKGSPIRAAAMKSLQPLQGALSDPNLGIRHGIALTAHDWTEREARLVVNLCRAYGEYILEEYKQSSPQTGV